MVSMRRIFRSRRASALALAAAALCLVASRAALAAGALEATISPTIADQGEPVRLTLRFTGDAPPARPDLTPLAADFDVVGSQQSERVSVVNGAVTRTRELEIVLAPKRSGAIDVPALHAGDLATAPLRLTVRDGATAPSAADPHAAAAGAVTSGAQARAARGGQAPPDLFVEASADQTSPFVQGEVRYTVRVYDGIGIREGALTEPAADGVRIEPRGDTRNYEEVVGGRRYVVHEREYAAFPQTSGAVTIPPVVLQARVPEADGRGARRSPFDDAFGDAVLAEMFAQMRRSGFGGSLIDRMMDPGREVRVRSNPVTLAVQGRPDEAGSGWFLPAKSVTLAQSWSPAEPAFRVGETVQRTIVLRADGASAAQLPALAPAEIAGVKQYAGKPETRAVAGGASVERTQTFDLLPTSAGTITLPRIDVQWWDVAAGAPRTASLPEETIEVLPAPGATAQQAAAAPATHASAARAAAGSAAPSAHGDAAARATSATGDAQAHAARGAGAEPSVIGDAAAAAPRDLGATLAAHRAAILAGLAALLALAAGALWTVRRRRSTPGAADAPPHAAPRVAARALVDALHQACRAGDARAVRDALLAWARATWHDAPASTTAVARRLGDPTFVRAAKALDDSLYAPHASALDGEAFWRAFDGARRASVAADASAPEVLPALYPESRLA